MEKLVPKIRFPEFEENWKIKNLKSELLLSRLGGNYSNSENINNYPLIKMGNIDRGKIKLDKIDYILENEIINSEDEIQLGDLFFNTRNTLELVGKVAIWRGELNRAYYNSNLMLLKFNNNYFMNYSFNSPKMINKLRNIATGTTSVAAIYSKDLFKLKLKLPSIAEQQKIATFLTSVDERITLLEKQKQGLETYKKGVMQQLFSQQLRFKPDPNETSGDDKDIDFPDWEEKKLGDIIKEQVFKSTINNQHVILSSTKDDVFIQSEFFTRDIASKNNIGYKILKRNQLVLSPQNIWMGNINLNKKYDIGIVSPSYKIFDFKKNFNPDFFSYFIKQPKLIFEYGQSSEQGASIVRRNLNLELFLTIRIKVPIYSEQQKIASFLSAIDERIAVVNKQIEQSKVFKKGLLQQMFL